MNDIVKIEQYADGFNVSYGDLSITINQEDSVERLIEIFNALDINAEFEDVY